MPVPKMARTPRPATSAIASTRPRRRPATGPARPPGPPDLVAPRSMMGNAAVAALLGGQQLGAEPGPSMWTGPSMLAGQDLVGNQAIANGATREPVKVPAGALPLTGPEKPKPDDARPGTPKAIPPSATKPEPQDQKDKPPAERPGKEPKKTKTGPPRSPAADPKFQALKKDVDAKKRKVGASHPPPAVEAGSAQGAAEPPPDDQEARGKVAHADEMDAAEPKTFDKKTFVDAVKKAIADRAPKNLEEADEFGDSGKAEEVKAEVQDKVGEGKDASSKEIAETTAEAPKPAPDAKTVVPMAPDQVPGKPGAPNPNQAAPDALPAEDTDMTAGPEQVGDQMAAAQVTEKQLSLENSREPSFGKAVQDKKAMDTHSAQAPSRLRKSEAREIKEVKTTAAGTGATAMTGLHATRVTTGKKVGTGKKGAKGRDEEKRLHVTAILQKGFDQTKCDVEKILSNLDKAVDRQFTAGEKAARNRFTAEHEEGMRRYKAERYGGWDGPFLWAKDKFMDLPEEANRIYERARDNYLAAMEQVITGIAGTVERELNRAKERIATGRTDLKKAVDKLPADLKAIGREAASEFEEKFDELKDTVNDKGTELVDTLATKYTDAVKSVDAEIAVEKEKNKGLVTKAAEAIGDAIETIKELGRMLMNVLRKAVSAIGLILRDPIGFLGRLIAGVGGGLKLFMKSAGRHLQQGVLAWLLGSGATAGLQLPTSFDVLGILVMIAAMLGLSWPNIRTRLARKVNPKTMAAAEAGKDAIPIVVEANKRGVAGLWSDLKSRVGDLKKDLISKLASYLLPTIILAGITWIISLFNPASAFIRACKMIIDIIRFIVTQARQIFEFINAVLDAVIAIARGGTGGVPTLIERALARSIPVLIGALAAILGVGGIAGKVKQIFQQISRPVNRAIDWVINKITGLLKKLWNKIKPKRSRKKPERGEQERTADRDKLRKSRRRVDHGHPVGARRRRKDDRRLTRKSDRKRDDKKNKSREVSARRSFSMFGKQHLLSAVLRSRRLRVLMASELGDVLAKVDTALSSERDATVARALASFRKTYTSRIEALARGSKKAENKKRELDELLRTMAAELTEFGQRHHRVDLSSYVGIGLEKFEVNRLIYDALGQARQAVLRRHKDAAEGSEPAKEELQIRFDRLMHATARLYRTASIARVGNAANVREFTGNVFRFAGHKYFVDHQNNYILPNEVVGKWRGVLDGAVYVSSKSILSSSTDLDSDPMRGLIERYAYNVHAHSASMFANLALLAASGRSIESSSGTMFLAAMIAEAERNPNAHVTNLLLMREGSTQPSFYEQAPMTRGGSDDPTAFRDPTIAGLGGIVRQPPAEVTDLEIALVRLRFEKHERAKIEEMIHFFGAHLTKAQLVQFLVDSTRAY